MIDTVVEKRYRQTDSIPKSLQNYFTLAITFTFTFPPHVVLWGILRVLECSFSHMSSLKTNSHFVPVSLLLVVMGMMIRSMGETKWDLISRTDEREFLSFVLEQTFV